MIDLNSIEYQLLERLLKSSQEVLLSGVSEYLVSQYSEDRVVTTDKYIIAFGNEPIGLVAHLDTVHSVPVKDLFYDTQQGVMWSPQGIGADDRAGVYSILEIIGRGYRPTVILTTDE